MTLETRLETLERKHARTKFYLLGLGVAVLLPHFVVRGTGGTGALELVDPRKDWRCEIFMETEDVADGRERAEVRCRFFDEDGNDLGTGALTHSSSRRRR